MSRLWVVGGGGAHAESLRASLAGHQVDFFDADVTVLCYLKTASEAPDLILVDGTLMMHEASELVRDLKTYPLLANGGFMVMDPLREDLPELESMRIPLVRKPVSAEQLKPFLKS